MTIFEKVRAILQRYPLIGQLCGVVHVDFADPEPASYGLTSTGDKLLNEDVLGNQERQHSFLLYMTYSGINDYERLINSNVLDNLAKWLEKQTDDTIIQISAENGMLAEVPEETIYDGIRYQLQIIVTYRVPNPDLEGGKTMEKVKLEKGLYHLTDTTFLEALEEMDPSEKYAGTDLAGTDAYERQLHRFGICTEGVNVDTVDKFFVSTESAVLFPEFIRRAILRGMNESILSEIAAVISNNVSNRYQGLEMDDTNPYTTTAAGCPMPVSTIMETARVVTLCKYGRTVNASYEVVRQQRLDVFALMLRRIGRNLAESMTADAVYTLEACGQEIRSKTNVLAYEDLAALYGTFGGDGYGMVQGMFDMKLMLVSPAVAAKIITMDQMKGQSSGKIGEIRLPFGTRMVVCKCLSDDTIVGLDPEYALEFIKSSDVVIEADKIIDRQLDCIGISMNAGFRALMAAAVRVLIVE